MIQHLKCCLSVFIEKSHEVFLFEIHPHIPFLGTSAGKKSELIVFICIPHMPIPL